MTIKIETKENETKTMIEQNFLDNLLEVDEEKVDGLPELTEEKLSDFAKITEEEVVETPNTVAKNPCLKFAIQMFKLYCEDVGKSGNNSHLKY